MKLSTWKLDTSNDEESNLFKAIGHLMRGTQEIGFELHIVEVRKFWVSKSTRGGYHLRRRTHLKSSRERPPESSMGIDLKRAAVAPIARKRLWRRKGGSRLWITHLVTERVEKTWLSFAVWKSSILSRPAQSYAIECTVRMGAWLQNNRILNYHLNYHLDNYQTDRVRYAVLDGSTPGTAIPMLRPMRTSHTFERLRWTFVY